MRVNIFANESNIITGYQEYPFDEACAWADIDDPKSIWVGHDRFENGEIVKSEEEYEEPRSVKIQKLKKALADSDYKALKHLEGALPDEEWEEAKAQRQAWRDAINQLQSSQEAENGDII